MIMEVMSSYRENMNNPTAHEFVEHCAQGHLQKIREIFANCSKEQRQHLIEYDEYKGFNQAVATGHTAIVNFLFSQVVHDATRPFDEPGPFDIPEEAVIPLFKSRDAQAFKNALANRHQETVLSIMEEDYLHDLCLDIIESNSLFINIVCEWQQTGILQELFEKACYDGRAPLEQLLANIPEKLHRALFTDNAFLQCCRGGNLEGLQFYWSLLDTATQQRLIEQAFGAFIIAAVKLGNKDVIQQLLAWSSTEQKENALRVDDYNAFVYAADRGHLDIVKMIYDALPSSEKSSAMAASQYAAYRLAHREGHHDVIRFLEQNMPQEMLTKIKSTLS